MANTLIDYLLFIGITKVFEIPLTRVWIAKAISAAVAIASSFYLNRTWVFGRGHDRVVPQAAAFLIVTLIGLYAVQTPLTHVFTAVIPEPGERSFTALRATGVVDVLPNVITEAFTIKTVAFLIASSVSTTWNFLAYRFFVFRSTSDH